MFKKDLRLNFISLRKGLAPEDLFNGSLAIANQSLKVPIWEGEFYHLFLPISEKKEVDTSFLLSILQGKDKQVVLSKVSAKNRLRHFLLTDSSTLKLNAWGIPEPTGGIAVDPKQLDVVFVPLLAFDTLGETPDDQTVYYFAGIDGARFKRPVEPGDQLILEVELDRMKAGIFKFKARAKVGDEIATEAELMCTMRKISQA